MSISFKLLLPVSIALAAVAPQVALAQDSAPAADVASFNGKTLYTTSGQRVGSIINVTISGIPQVVLAGKVRSVPAESLSVVDGKLATSLSKKELSRR